MADEFEPLNLLNLNSQPDSGEFSLPDFAAPNPATAALEQASQRAKRNLDKSLVSKLGLDGVPILEQTANNAASVWSGAARLASNLITAPIDLAADYAQSNIPDEMLRIYSGEKYVENSDEDNAKLDQEAPPTLDGLTGTWRQRIESMNDLRKTSKGIYDTLDLSGLIKTDNRDELSDSLKYETRSGVRKLREAGVAFDKGDYAEGLSQGIKGIGSVIANAVPTAAENPAAIGEYVGENLPQLFLATKTIAGAAAANIGYGLNEYRDGITDFQEENNGALPQPEQMRKMAAAAASAAIAEHVGEMTMVGKILHGKNPGIARTVLGSSAVEGATEGYQTWAEGQAHLRDASLEEIVEGATIGAAVGGVLGGGSRALARSPEAQEAARPATEQAYDQAVASGDVSALSDPTSETYSPVRAVQALHQTILKDGATEEQSTQAIEQAQAIRTELETRAQEIQEIYSEQGQQEIRDYIAQVEQSNSPDAEANLAELNGLLHDPAAPTERYQQDQQELSTINTQLKGIDDTIRLMRADTAPTQERVDALVNDVNNNQSKQAADEVMTLTMTNPDSISRSAIDSLLNNADSVLTEDQRTALRAFSEAYEAADSLTGLEATQTDVFQGRDQFKGLNQYRSDLANAIQQGDTAKGEAVTQQLQTFADTRQAKYEAIRDAYEQVKGTNESIQLVPSNGAWVQPDTKLNRIELERARGVTVNAASFKLRDAVQLEATVLSKNVESFAALVRVMPEVRNDTYEGLNTNQETNTEEQVQEQEEVQETAEPTGLTALKERSEVTPDTYTSTNLVSAYFKQNLKYTLARESDFMTKVRGGSVSIIDYLPKDKAENLSGKQKDALNTFNRFTREASNQIRKVFNKPKKAGYQYQDAAGFFRNEDGSIDENVITAISYGMYSYIADEAGSLINDMRDINRILHRADDSEVSNEAVAMLRRIGNYENNVQTSIGSSIYKALGLKALPSAPVNERARIESALGVIAINAMIEMGIAERPRISAKEMGRLMGDDAIANSKAVFRFFRIKAEEDLNGKPIANPKAQRVRDVSIGTQGIVDALFDTEKQVREPSFKPQSFKQEFAKNTQQGISEYQRDALNKVARQKHTLNPGVWAVWQQMSPEARYAMAGVVDMDSTPVHIQNRDSQKAKNAGLIQQVDNAEAFFNAMLADPTLLGEEQPVYFMPSVWRNYRVGLDGTVINPQTSKVHRYLLTMPEWEATLNFDDKAQMDMFKLRVLEAFGVKTESKSTQDVLNDFKKGYDAQLAKPEIQAAIEAINTDGNEKAILAGVKAAGEGYHSLSALVALAEMQRAQEAGQKSFKTTMPGEVDGVTNGPQLSLQMMGTADTAISSQGGFFEIGQLDAKGNQLTQFNDYHGMPGNLDMYENLISKVLRALNPQAANLVSAIEGIVGSLWNVATGDIEKAGRNIIKTPLTALMFGSKPERAAQSMAETFVENVYTKIESMNNDQDNIGEVVKHINTLMGKNSRLHISETITYAKLMETRFTNAQVSAIKDSFYTAIGQATENMFKTEFSMFLKRRDAINSAANASFKIYEAVHNAVRAQIIENSPNMPKNGKGEALHDLSQTQLKELETILEGVKPVVNTAMSLRSGDMGAGMLMAKTKTQQITSVPYNSQMDFGTEVGGIVDAQGVPQAPVKSTSTYGKGRVLEEPGVGPASMLIHSSDSAAATGVYGELPALNVHDAVVTGWNDLAQAGQKFNESVFNTLVSFSAPTEMRKTLENTLIGLAPFLKDPVLGPVITDVLKVSFTNAQGRFFSPEDTLYAIRDVANLSDSAKFDRFINTYAVGQYATEGGSYIVTEADRKKLNDLKGKIGADEKADAATVAKAISKAGSALPVETRVEQVKTELSNLSVETLAPSTTLNSLEQAKKAAPKKVAQAIQDVQDKMVEDNSTLQDAKTILDETMQGEVVAAVNEHSRPETSVWGELGEPLVASDPTLVQALESTPDMTVHNLVDVLKAHVGQTYTVNSANYLQTILDKVKQATKASVPVVYVTSETGPEGAYGEGVTKARGWYSSVNGTGTVYFKSPEFRESGLTVELMVHELVHVATAHVIQREQAAKAANPAYKSNALGLVNDLETLLSEAQQYIGNRGELSGKYSNAVSNVYELVSWGLTNAGFQKEVLKQIKGDNTQRGNPLLNGLQRFIDRVTGLLFRNVEKRTAENTGLGLLISHVSGIFEEAAKLQTKNDTFTLKYEDAVDGVLKLSTTQVYDALANNANKVTNEAHDTHLRGLIDSIVTKLHGPAGALKLHAAHNQAMTTEEIFLKALQTGQMPFASKALVSDFVLNKQEQFVLEQVEATVDAALNTADNLFIKTSMERLYQDAKRALKGKLTQDKYDFLFDQTSGANNRSQYLSRFIALGLVSEEVNAALDFETTDPRKNLSDLSWPAKLIEVFQRALNKLGALHDHTFVGQKASSKLDSLMDRLVDIEAKHKAKIAENRLSLMDQAEIKLGAIGTAVRDRIEAMANADVIQNSRFNLVRAAGNIVSTVAGDRVEAVLDHVNNIRDNAFKNQTQGLGAGILTEIRGVNDTNRAGADLFTTAQANQQLRQNVKNFTAESVINSFDDGGKYLTDKHKAALTKVLLRTNLQATLSQYGLAKLKTMVKDDAALDTSIKSLESKLNQEGRFGRYYKAAAKDLGYHKAVGGSVSANQMLNTRNIAEMIGTQYQGSVDKNRIARVTKVLDVLTPLYALKYSNMSDRMLVNSVMSREASRTDGSGVEMILKLHGSLLKDSTDRLFESQENLQIMGYTPEIHDSKVEVIFISPKNKEYFEKRGFNVGNAVQTDPDVRNAEPLLVAVRHGSGQTGILTGAISYTGMHTKGSRLEREAIDLVNKPGKADPAQVAQLTKARKQAIADMFKTSDSYDPRKVKANRMVPLLNPQGGITGYRYMMTETNRDAYLNRDNSMDQVLGTLASQTLDKDQSRNQNLEVVRAMYDQYRDEYNKRPSSFVTVGKDSTNAQLSELYRLLPYHTKEEIKAVWGQDNMMIRADMVDMIMGYRKYSLTTAFDKDAYSLSRKKGDVTTRNVAEQVLVNLAGAVWGEKAQLRIGQVEDVMQELVKEAKDIIVIKNISTLVGNILSNVTLLAWEGVPIKQAIQSHAIGLKGAIDYRRDFKRLTQLEEAKNAGYVPNGIKAVEDELVVLKDRIARNPVKPLIDAGLMPTIVEDVEASDSNYSYKSKLATKVQKYTDKLPQLVRNIGKEVYMTHDTSTYKFLSQTTQLSDFVARYTQYVHTTTRAKDRLTSAEALQQAADSFINYDLPSHRTLQYLNDMGIVWFTKYFLRIQKTITRLVREKPARALAMVAAGHYFHSIPTVIDSSWVNHIGNNPFHMGAFNYPGTLDELPTVQGLMNLTD